MDRVKITQEQINFLNNLRASGLINMFGASKELRAEYGLNKHEARDILKQWLDQF